MTQDSPQKKVSASGWVVRVSIILFTVLIIGLVALWAGRKALVERAVQSWCEGQNFACSITVAELGRSSARIEGLKIDSGPATPFEAQAVELSYGWASPTRVQVQTVTLDRPVIHGVLTDEGLSFFGLETLYENDGTSAPTTAPVPHVSIEHGDVVLQTAAGEVSARFQAGGRLIEDGFINAEITPASLRHDDALLHWSRGLVDLRFERGAVTGKIDIAIEQAKLGVLSAQMTQINADIADGDSALQIVMTASADSISQGERRGSDLQMDLVGYAARPEAGETFDLLGALRSATLEIRARELADGTTVLKEAHLVADMETKARVLVGPVALMAEGFSSDEVRMGALSLSGDLAYAELDPEAPEKGQGVTYNGRFVLRNVDASRAGLVDVFAPEDLPSAVQPHAHLSKRVLSKALSDFDFGTSFALSFKENQWMVAAPEPVLLQAASGLTVAIDPLPAQPWLRFDSNGLLVSGLVKIEGGGGPDFQTYINDLTWHDGHLEISARDGLLEAWTVEDATLSLQFGGMSFQSGAASRFFVDGEVGVSGAFAGVSLGPTRLFGRLEGVRGGEGWRVQTAGSQCVGLTMGEAQSGTVTLSPLAISLCPVDGRFVRQEAGKMIGQIHLGDIELPFSTIDSSGAFNFSSARLGWVSGEELELTIQGQALSLPMRIGDRSLVISSADPTVSANVGDGPLQIRAELDNTHFSGSMIPAKVRADAFAFDGMAADEGFEGRLTGRGVHISDLAADPLYEPIVTDLEGDLRDGGINMKGALLNEKTQTPIADFRLDLDLTELNGSAGLQMRQLNFQPGGLQPTALSEQLRGVLINTRGALGGQADFNILNGELEGTGEIVLENVSFDTFKTGTVSGVNGRIEFWDILELKSHPHQMFTIAELNPGIPLRNGVVRFQLNGADALRLETARWPFAGGTIRVQPTEWVVNGQNEIVMVELETIELAELIETLKVPDLVATGTVSGAFPIEFDGANIMVRQAILKADESGGVIGYTGTATAPVEGQNQFADYAFDALKNFDFTVMQLGVDGNLIGRLLVSIDLVGNNAAVLDGKPFKFGINVDSELLPLLTSLRNVPTESFVTEALALEREAQERESAGEQSN